MRIKRMKKSTLKRIVSEQVNGTITNKLDEGMFDVFVNLFMGKKLKKAKEEYMNDPEVKRAYSDFLSASDELKKRIEKNK